MIDLESPRFEFCDFDHREVSSKILIADLINEEDECTVLHGRFADSDETLFDNVTNLGAIDLDLLAWMVCNKPTLVA